MEDIDYRDIYWMNGKWTVFEEIDNISGLPFLINSCKKATVFVLNEPHINEIPSMVGDFTVSEVYLKCKKWQLRLPETVEKIVIDRSPSEEDPVTSRYEFGTSKDSSFYIDVSNNYLMSDYNGSVYSKDKKILYHFHSSEDTEFLKELEIIYPGAIYKPTMWMPLLIPEKCKVLHKDAINGFFSVIDFTGGLNVIEKNAFHNISCKNVRINGLISSINEMGVSELKVWNKNYLVNPLSLLAPKPQGGKILEDNDIELTKHLSITEKMEMHKDWYPFTISSLIDNSVEDISIDVESITISNNLYSEIEATRLILCNGKNESISIVVLEKKEEVTELLLASKKYRVNTK